MLNDPSLAFAPTQPATSATPSDEPTAAQRSAWARSSGLKSAAVRKAKREQQANSQSQGPEKKKVTLGASTTGELPDLATRDGRIQAHHEIIRRFWRGEARPPEAVSALKELSRIYDDKQALEDERTRPSPAAVAAWIVRSVLAGDSIAEAMQDIDALALALGDAIGRKVSIAGQKPLTSTSAESTHLLNDSTHSPAPVTPINGASS